MDLITEQQKKHTEVEKAIANTTSKMLSESKRVQDELQVQEQLEELEQKQVEREIERENIREMEQEMALERMEVGSFAKKSKARGQGKGKAGRKH